jgi:mRNA interferase YafQ
MFTIQTTKQFEKDYKLCKKRGLKMEMINATFEFLEQTGVLPSKYKMHKLSGNFKGCWECHLMPDWLMIWMQNDDDKTIQLIRTGSHSDLF